MQLAVRRGGERSGEAADAHTVPDTPDNPVNGFKQVFIAQHSKI